MKLNLGAGGAAGIKEDWNGSGGIVLLGSNVAEELERDSGGGGGGGVFHLATGPQACA